MDFRFMNDKIFEKTLNSSLVKGKTYKSENSDIGVKLQMLKNAKEVYLLYQEAIKQEKSGNSSETIKICNKALNMLMVVQKDAKHKDFTANHVSLFLDKYGKEPTTYKNSSFTHDYPIGMKYKNSDLPNTILVCEDRFTENESSEIKREFLLRLNFMEMSLRKRIDWNRYIMKNPDWTPNDMWEFLNDNKNKNSWWPIKGYKNIKDNSYAMEGLFDKKVSDPKELEKLLVDCIKAQKAGEDSYKKGLWGKAYQNNTKAENLIKQIMKMLNSKEYDNAKLGEIMKSSGVSDLPISQNGSAVYNSAMLRMVKKANSNNEYRDATKNQYLLMRKLALLLINIRLNDLEIKYILDTIDEKRTPSKAGWRQYLDQMWSMYEPYLLSGGYKFYSIE